MRLISCLIAWAIGSGASLADSSSFSFELGLIVGSAEVCGYELDEAAVLAYVAENVPGSDMRFAANFQMHVGYHRREAEGLADLERKVHCDAARRSAEFLNLLTP